MINSLLIRGKSLLFNSNSLCPGTPGRYGLSAQVPRLAAGLLLGFPRQRTLDRGSGGSVSAAPHHGSGLWVPKGIGVQSPPPPNTASMQRGYQMVLGHSLWSRSGRSGNSESAAVLIQASHLFFGRDSHLSHFDPTASCPPAFHCLWSRGCSLPPDILTPATAPLLDSHPLFQTSKPVLTVNTSMALRPLHWECSLVPEPLCPWVFVCSNCPFLGEDKQASVTWLFPSNPISGHYVLPTWTPRTCPLSKMGSSAQS